jgi:DNA-binding transcriptional regulator PaaX
MDQKDKNQILCEELYDGFDSFNLLTAVDHLDQIRYRLAEGVNFEPPQVRQDLMKLHQMVMNASNASSQHSYDDILLEADAIEDTIWQVQQHTDKLLDILSKLNKVLGKVFDRIEEIEASEEEEDSL